MLKTILYVVGPLPFFLLTVVTIGLSLGPAILFYRLCASCLLAQPMWLQVPALGITVATCFYLYGFTLILVAPLLNFILRGRLRPWRGPAVSLGCLPWYIHATLTLVPRLTFLEFVTPSFFSEIFYRLMGMKIGSNVAINSTAICDPSLIEMGDKVTIGGSASIMAHYAQGGYLVIAPVKIGNGATIGLRAVIMGGTEIGEKAKLLANSFVLPNTKIPAEETWAGIPAQKIDLKKFKQGNDECT